MELLMNILPMGKQFFVDFKWAFSLIMETKKDKYASPKLNYEFWINYRNFKEITKFSDFNSFHCVQWPTWSGEPYLLDL